MTCEHNSGFPCHKAAAWIGTDAVARAFCDEHKILHERYEGTHFVPLTPELEEQRLQVLAAQKACPRCGGVRKP